MLLLKKAATACVASCLLVCSSHVLADNATGIPHVELAHKWFANVAVEQVSIDQAAADREWIDNSALSFNIAGEYFFDRNVSGRIGAGYLQYDDNNAFTQQTKSTYSGKVQNSKSTASAIPLYFDAGYTRYFDSGVPVYLMARVGFETLLDSSRAISNCSNCDSENIDIKGGAYAVVGAGVNLGSSFSLGIFYQNFLSGDLNNTAGIQLSFGEFLGL